jgi:hypothetical protein
MGKVEADIQMARPLSEVRTEDSQIKIRKKKKK